MAVASEMLSRLSGHHLLQALEHNPEVFGSVEMLYVDMEVKRLGPSLCQQLPLCARTR